MKYLTEERKVNLFLGFYITVAIIAIAVNVVYICSLINLY